MDARKIRNKNELRIQTRYPNETEEMLKSLPGCIVTNHTEVWNGEGEWCFWVKLPNEKLTFKLQQFLSCVKMNQYHDKKDRQRSKG